MSRFLKTTFLVHAILSVFAGLVMYLIPGRFLFWLGWAPIDPILSRLLGAVFLAMAWSDVRAMRDLIGPQARVLIEFHAVLTVLASIGILRHVLPSGGWVPALWIVLIIFMVFAIAWVIAWTRTDSS